MGDDKKKHHKPGSSSPTWWEWEEFRAIIAHGIVLNQFYDVAFKG